MSPEQDSFLNAYEDGDDVVLVRRESGELRKRVVPSEWSSFYKMADFEKVRREVESNRYVLSTRDEGDWVRVRWRDRWIRRKATARDSPLHQARVVAYEGDVDPVRRYMADEGIGIAKPLRCFLDIETDSRVPPRQAVLGKARILSWAITHDDGSRFVTDHAVLDVDTDGAEGELLEKLWNRLWDFDQVLAWNGGDLSERSKGFDVPIIRQRTAQRGVRIKDPRRLVWLDQMRLFERMNKNAAESGAEKVSLKLDSICQAKLGEGKADLDASRIYEEWAAGGSRRDRMVSYMDRDTVLQAKLDRKVGYADLHDAVCQVCNCFPDTRSLHPTVFVDGYMLRRGVEAGIHFPTRSFVDEAPDEEKEGAWCLAPQEQGFLSDVQVFDFKSLYPSIVITLNMSPETKVPSCPKEGPLPPNVCRAPTTKIGFRTDVVGMLPGALIDLIDRRDYYKKLKNSLPPNTPEWFDADRLSTGYKTAANSMFGVLGNAFSRYQDKEIFESITQTGVWVNRKIIEIGEQRRIFRVVYADTDSAYAMGVSDEVFAAFVKECNDSILPSLVAEFGGVDNRLALAYEKKFARLLFTAGKRYVGAYRHYGGKVANADTKPEVRGLEWRRGDTNAIARAMQSEIIDLAGGQDDQRAHDVGLYREIVARYRDRVLNGELSVDEVQQTNSLTKDLNDYVVKTKKDGTAGAIQPHVQVANLLLDRGENIVVGERISYVVTDGSDRIVAIPASDYDGTNVDRFYLWEVKVWPPTERVVQAAFPNVDWSEYGRARPIAPSRREVKARAAGQGFARSLRRTRAGAIPSDMTPDQEAEQVLEDVDERCGPDEMSQQEALDFLEELESGIQSRIAGIRSDMGDG